MVQSLSILFKLKIYINAPSQIFDVGLGFFLEWGSSEKSSVDFSFINYTLTCHLWFLVSLSFSEVNSLIHLRNKMHNISRLFSSTITIFLTIVLLTSSSSAVFF